MSNYGNFVTVVGQVYDKSMKNDIGNGLGKLTLDVGDGRAYINLWNPQGKQHVEKFFESIANNDNIQIKGQLQEETYQGEYKRKVKGFVSSGNGVSYNIVSPDTEGKYVAALSGDVVEQTYDMVNGVSRLEITLVIYNTFDSKDRDNILTRQEVLMNELNSFKDYVLKAKNIDDEGLNLLNRLIESTSSNNSIENITKILLKFEERFHPKKWNIDILHLTAHGTIAEQIGNKIDVYDNVQFGVVIKNMKNVDEYGFVDGYVNEIEIKKVKEIIKHKNNQDDFF
jgi:hypothetical protein